MFVVWQRYDFIAVFSSSFPYHRKNYDISVPGMTPVDIVASPDDVCQLYVADLGNSSVWIVSLSSTADDCELDCDVLEEPVERPRTISVGIDRQLLVIPVSRRGLYIYSRDEPVRHIPVELSWNSAVAKLMHAVEMDRDTYVVCAVVKSPDRRIVVLEVACDGSLLAVFDDVRSPLLRVKCCGRGYKIFTSLSSSSGCSSMIIGLDDGRVVRADSGEIQRRQLSCFHYGGGKISVTPVTESSHIQTPPSRSRNGFFVVIR